MDDVQQCPSRRSPLFSLLEDEIGVGMYGIWYKFKYKFPVSCGSHLEFGIHCGFYFSLQE